MRKWFKVLPLLLCLLLLLVACAALAEKDIAGAVIKVKGEQTYTYDREPHQPEVAVTLEKGSDIIPLDQDEDYTLRYTGDCVNAGKRVITVTVTGTGNYSGTLTETFDLTITPASVAVSGTTANSKTYDGTTTATVNCGEADGIFEDDTQVKLLASGKFEDAHAENNKVVTITYSLTGDGSSNYAAPNPSQAAAAIFPAELTVTTQSASKAYDGKALTASGRLDGLVNNEDAGFAVTGSRTEIGTSTNSYTIEWDGTALASDYSLPAANVHLGTLTVTEGSIVYTLSDSVSVVYDAQPHSVAVTDVTPAGAKVEYSLNNGSTWESGSSYALTDVTASPVSVSFRISADNYTPVQLQPVTLNISAKAVTVKAEDKTKALGADDPKWTASVIGTLGSDSDSLVYSFSREPGENAGNYTITPGGAAKQGNYSVNYESGTLTVTEGKITYTLSDSVNVVYDAQPHSVAVTDVTPAGAKVEYSLNNGGTWQSGSSYALTDVTEGPVSVRFRISADNYTPVQLQPVTLNISAKAVTVKAEDKTKALGADDPTWTASVIGTLGSDSDSLVYSFSREPGENAGSYTITPGGAAKQGNYSVSYESGTLTVTEGKITYTLSDSVSVVYDAQSHSVAVTDVTPAGAKVEYSLNNGSTWESGSSYALTDVTVSPVSVRFRISADNYTPVQLQPVTLNISAKAVTVKAEDKTKALGADDPKWTAAVIGTLGSDSDSLIYSFSREPGENAGSYTITPGGAAKQGNYSVSYESGTLTVTEGKITYILSDSVSVVYDAKPHSVAVTDVTPAGAKVEYSLNNGGTWESGSSYALTDVTDGPVSVSFRISADNYTPVELPTVTLNITYLRGWVKAIDKTMTFGDKVPEMEVEVSLDTGASGLISQTMTLGDKVPEKEVEVILKTGVGGNIYKIKYKIDDIEPKNQGVYTIKVTGKEIQENHKIEYVDGTLTVNARDGNVEASSGDLAKIQEKYAEQPEYQNEVIDVTIEVDSNVSEADEALIRSKASQTGMVCYNVELLLSVDGATRNIGDENDVLISTTYAFDFTGKTDIMVARVHDGEYDELTEKPNAYGERVKYDSAAGRITVTAGKYSTYAILYNVKSIPKTGDDTPVALYACLALGAVVILLLCIRKSSR